MNDDNHSEKEKIYIDQRTILLDDPELRKKQIEKEIEETRKVLYDAVPEIIDRMYKLGPLHTMKGNYLPLLQEARNLYVYGFFPSCVIMCGTTAERIIKDILIARVGITPFRDGHEVKTINKKAQMTLYQIQSRTICNFLFDSGVLEDTNNKLKKSFKRVADLRNQYAHGQWGDQVEKDADEAINCLKVIIHGTVSIFQFFKDAKVESIKCDLYIEGMLPHEMKEKLLKESSNDKRGETV